MKALLFILACLLAGAVQGDAIEIIELRNRPAAELIPIIKPMLEDGGSISGQGFQLFVRAGEDNLAQIRRLVEKLDSAARQLLISVFQGSESELETLRLSGAIQYRDGDADIRIGGKPAPGGAGFRYGTDDASLSGSARSTRSQVSEHPVHRLRVSEGSEGYIETGQAIPFFAGAVWPGKRGPVAAGGVDYRDVTTGFYVLPRLHGQQVSLEVSPHKEALSRSGGGAIDVQSASTTVSGPVGQWIAIGGVSTESSRARDAIGSHAATRSRRDDSIWIRADIVE